MLVLVGGSKVAALVIKAVKLVKLTFYFLNDLNIILAECPALYVAWQMITNKKPENLVLFELSPYDSKSKTLDLPPPTAQFLVLKVILKMALQMQSKEHDTPSQFSLESNFR